MLTGFDLDLSRQVNQVSNRIRGLFTQIHPELEKVLGIRLEHDAILHVLATWPTPPALKKAGRARIDAKLKKHGARRHTAWTTELLEALSQQSVTVTGTEAAGLVIPHLARQLLSLHAQRADVAIQVEKIVANHPLYPAPEIHARQRSQDRRRDHRRALRQDIYQLRRTSVLRRPRTHHEAIGIIH